MGGNSVGRQQRCFTHRGIIVGRGIRHRDAADFCAPICRVDPENSIASGCKRFAERAAIRSSGRKHSRWPRSNAARSRTPSDRYILCVGLSRTYDAQRGARSSQRACRSDNDSWQRSVAETIGNQPARGFDNYRQSTFPVVIPMKTFSGKAGVNVAYTMAYTSLSWPCAAGFPVNDTPIVPSGL